MTTEAVPARRSQAARREQSRDALLEAAARGISRAGYANLRLEDVAREAGYTRGALYHQFAGKQELTLAVVAWVQETWYAEMGQHLAGSADPVAALRAVARGHAVYCRRDVARVMMALRVEFSGQDNPIARAVRQAVGRVVGDCTQLIVLARENGLIPPGPPPETLANAVIGAVEGLVIAVAGSQPLDEELAERVVDALLDLS
jgi:AcrR family transcriptional regulator